MKGFETLLVNRLFNELRSDWKCTICNKTKQYIKSVNSHQAITKLQCNHCFCHDCIDQWLSSFKNCPRCSETVYKVIVID